MGAAWDIKRDAIPITGPRPFHYVFCVILRTGGKISKEIRKCQKLRGVFGDMGEGWEKYEG